MTDEQFGERIGAVIGGLFMLVLLINTNYNDGQLHE